MCQLTVYGHDISKGTRMHKKKSLHVSIVPSQNTNIEYVYRDVRQIFSNVIAEVVT